MSRFDNSTALPGPDHARPRAPQLFVVSDSTAADWLNGPKHGWAQELPQYFRAGVSVANYAAHNDKTTPETASFLRTPGS